MLQLLPNDRSGSTCFPKVCRCQRDCCSCSTRRSCAYMLHAARPILLMKPYCACYSVPATHQAVCLLAKSAPTNLAQLCPAAHAASEMPHLEAQPPHGLCIGLVQHLGPAGQRQNGVVSVRREAKAARQLTGQRAKGWVHQPRGGKAQARCVRPAGSRARAHLERSRFWRLPLFVCLWTACGGSALSVNGTY